MMIITSLKQRGFTLMELIVTVTVMGILAAIAIPSFFSTIQNEFSISVKDDFVLTMQFIRSEAIKRARNVSMCAPTDSTFTACGTNWSLGWFIFTDVNGNGTYNGGTDVILRRISLTGSNAVITSTGNNYASYTSAGFPAGNTGGVTYTIYATGCSGAYANTVAVSTAGRLTITPINCP